MTVAGAHIRSLESLDEAVKQAWLQWQRLEAEGCTYGTAVDLAEAGKTDRLQSTIDYSAVFDLIADIVQNKSFSLLEGLATELAASVLDVFPVIEATIRVRKLIPPISGYVDHIEVEVTRRQTDPEKLLASEENDG